jgi:hypothetical protein
MGSGHSIINEPEMIEPEVNEQHAVLKFSFQCYDAIPYAPSSMDKHWVSYHKTISGSPEQVRNDFDELKKDPRNFITGKYIFDDCKIRFIEAVLYTADGTVRF